MIIRHKPKCGIYDITTIRTSSESHKYWKKLFHKNPFYFRICANFEADSEIDNSSIGIQTSNIYKQNTVLNGYRVDSELDYF